MPSTGKLEQTINDYLIAIAALLSETFSTAFLYLKDPTQLFSHSNSFETLPIPPTTFFALCTLIFLFSLSVGSRLGLKHFMDHAGQDGLAPTTDAAVTLKNTFAKMDTILAKVAKLFFDVKLPTLIILVGLLYIIPASFSLLMAKTSALFGINIPPESFYALNSYTLGCIALVYSAFNIIFPPHFARMNQGEIVGIAIFNHFIVVIGVFILFMRYAFVYFQSLINMTDAHWSMSLLHWLAAFLIWSFIVKLILNWYKPLFPNLINDSKTPIK